MFKHNEIITQFYEIALQLVPSVCYKTKYTGDPNDLVHDFILRVICKKYYNKYNKNLGSLKRYVFVSLKNLALNKFRDDKLMYHLDISTVEEVVETSSVKNSFSSRDVVDKSDLVPISSYRNPDSSCRVEKTIQRFDGLYFRKSTLSHGDVLRLLGEGFSISSIARFGKLSPTAVTKVVKKIRIDLGSLK